MPGLAPHERRAGLLVPVDADSLVDRFVWTAPVPSDRFVGLIRATCSRFPEFPPYEGEGGEPKPRLTVAAVDVSAPTEAIARLARSEMQARLPFGFTVEPFEEQEGATWLATTR